MIDRRLAVGVAALATMLAITTTCGTLRARDDGAQQRFASLPKARSCTRKIGPDAALARALHHARPGAVICLRGGTYPGDRIPAEATNKSSFVTLRPVPGSVPVFGSELAFEDARHLRLKGLTFKDGVSFAPAAAHVELIGNDLTGAGGMFFFGDTAQGGRVSSVLIQGNHIHHIDYMGPQGTYRGYGIKSIGSQDGFTVRHNEIKSVGADYIQTDRANDWTVEDNTFLGPSLAHNHPQEHQDLWQVYAGGRNLKFADNVARNTGTDQSLLFQMTYPGDRFYHVTVADNLFDHDSRGYTCQIYQAAGLVFHDNTIVGSRWGCLFRDEPGFPDGSAYRVNHNIFAQTREGPDLSTEGSAGEWGTYDYNVSSDGTAGGSHSVRNWMPSWVNRIYYRPRQLPFRAGYRPRRP